MKIVFILTKSRYRLKNLNNFGKNKKIGKYLIINLYSFLRYLYVFLKKINFLYFVSVDNCIFIKKNKAFNFWMTGTIHKIPEDKKNNTQDYVNMKSVFHDKDKIFQIYPISLKKNKMLENKKLVFVSSYEIYHPNISEKIWNEINNKCLENFNFFDEKNFWHNTETKKLDYHLKFLIYRDLKNFQRKQIVSKLIKMYPNQFELYGTNWDLITESKIRQLKHKEAMRLYNGNICLDLGSKCGSLTLYPRSINIIESGGLLLQLKQSDSQIIFGDNEKLFTFTSFDDLDFKLKNILNDFNYYNELIDIQFQTFRNSYKKIEKQLDEIF